MRLPVQLSARAQVEVQSSGLPQAPPPVRPQMAMPTVQLHARLPIRLPVVPLSARLQALLPMSMLVQPMRLQMRLRPARFGGRFRSPSVP